MNVDYAKLAQEIGALVQTKNAAYGDSHTKSGEVLKLLYPDGVKPEAFVDMLTIVRILDKLFRVATDKDALGEDPFRDICGYSLLATARRGSDPMCLECSKNVILLGYKQLCRECCRNDNLIHDWPNLDALWKAGGGAA